MPLLVEVYPESPWPWFDLGSRYLLSGKKAQADSCLRRSLELEPKFSYADWILQNIDELLEIAKIQVAMRDAYAPGENTGIQGPYLGEKPPGLTPKVFAPGILCSTQNEFSITFSPDGREIYFSRTGAGVMLCRWEEQGWTAPTTVQFFDGSFYIDEPSVSPDGCRVFLNVRPSLRDPRTIYQAERVGDGWGPPEPLFTGMYATSTLDGTLYYTVTTERRDGGVIAKSRPTDEGYSDPEVLGGGVNTQYIDAHPYIAPDESFILFDSNRDQTNGLYVCFRREHGHWGEAICLNDHLDIPRLAGQCALSPDGKYLFYSLHDDMYWVSAEILDELRPE
jgi:hypothetical protein